MSGGPLDFRTLLERVSTRGSHLEHPERIGIATAVAGWEQAEADIQLLIHEVLK